jgi:plasmid stabilization system protein ParE
VTEIRWTEQAVDNLAAIKAFIGQDSPAYALAVVGRLYQAVTQLGQFPDSGRMVPEQSRPEIRDALSHRLSTTARTRGGTARLPILTPAPKDPGMKGRWLTGA